MYVTRSKYEGVLFACMHHCLHVSECINMRSTFLGMPTWANIGINSVVRNNVPFAEAPERKDQKGPFLELFLQAEAVLE